MHTISSFNGYVEATKPPVCKSIPDLGHSPEELAVRSKEMDKSPQTSFELVVLIKLIAFISGMF